MASETTKLVSLDDVISPYITACIYGAAGVGKTTLACGSQYLRTFLFDVDKGTLSLTTSTASQKLMAAGIPPINKKLVSVWTVNTAEDYLRGLDYLYKHINNFDLVVMDTATELQNIVLSASMKKGNRVKANQDDWGASLYFLEELGRNFKNMGKHSIFLAHEVAVAHNSGRSKYVASFRGQFADGYTKHFSLIMRYLMLESEVAGQDGSIKTQLTRCLECNKGILNDCKDRSAALDPYEYPILDNIIYKIWTAVTQQAPQQAPTITTL